MRTTWVAGLVLGLAGTLPLAADDPAEETLRSAFEGRYVTVRIDMPATHEGVDLRFDRGGDPLDERRWSDRLRERGLAIREGDRVPVTRIKLKKDMIEFQLAGGGFNWTWDASNPSFKPTPPSSRERELERRIREETDTDRRRRLERELDRLRRQREDHDEWRRRREKEEADERNRERARRKGSRFNLRFDDEVPAEALTAEGLERLLAPWIDFGRSRPPDDPDDSGDPEEPDQD